MTAIESRLGSQRDEGTSRFSRTRVNIQGLRYRDRNERHGGDWSREDKLTVTFRHGVSTEGEVDTKVENVKIGIRLMSPMGL